MSFSADQHTQLLTALWGAPRTGEHAGSHARRQKLVREYVTHLALSNTSKPYEEDGLLKFQSESAEEQAMVTFAHHIGFTKVSTNPTRLQIQTYTPDLKKAEVETQVFRHVATLGFTPARARVTVIYHQVSTGKIRVMSKGQDTVMFPLMGHFDEEHTVAQRVEVMCNNGLRTLLAGFAELPVQWWADREAQYTRVVEMDESKASEGHSEGNCDKAQCEKCAAHACFQRIEQEANLQYLGCFGMEDKLQPLVPESISDYSSAGIKVWMITGDKLETAKNIGLATNLIDPDMEAKVRVGMSPHDYEDSFANSRLVEITGRWSSIIDSDTNLLELFKQFDTGEGKVSSATLKKFLDAMHLPYIGNLDLSSGGQGNAELTFEHFKDIIKETQLTPRDAVEFDIEEGLRRYNSICDHTTHPVSLLINRDAFNVMFPGGRLEEEEEQQLERVRQKFFVLASVARSVIFARAEPSMKKKMVTELQSRFPTATVLAVGDGANDTDMIKAANVGVGIAGVEGTAATNNADYAIGQFHMLHSLLFVHGTWNYLRTSELVNFIFYKAILLAMTPYFFAFFSMSSGQQYFNDSILLFYNVSFTALPVLVVAVLDQPLPRDVMQNFPQIYKESKGVYFRSRTFASWVLKAVVHSLILFFVPYLCEKQSGVLQSNGQTHGLWLTSTVVYYCVVLLPTFLIIFSMNKISRLHVASVLLSVLALVVVTYSISALKISKDMIGVIDVMWESWSCWFIMGLSVGLPLVLEWGVKSCRRKWRPSFNRIVRERLHKNAVDGDRSGILKFLPRLPRFEQRSYSSVPDTAILEPQEYESKWKTRKAKTKRETAETESQKALEKLQEKLALERHSTDDMRRIWESLIKGVLKFRRMQETHFASATRAQFQIHDKFDEKQTDDAILVSSPSSHHFRSSSLPPVSSSVEAPVESSIHVRSSSHTYVDKKASPKANILEGLEMSVHSL